MGKNYEICVSRELKNLGHRNAAALSNHEFAEGLKAQIPMHRFGSVDECAELIAFLASDAASYITGAEIPIAGGWQL